MASKSFRGMTEETISKCSYYSDIFQPNKTDSWLIKMSGSPKVKDESLTVYQSNKVQDRGKISRQTEIFPGWQLGTQGSCYTENF